LFSFAFLLAVHGGSNGCHASGHGLENIENRVKEMKGDVQIETTTGMTIVKISIPL